MQAETPLCIPSLGKVQTANNTNIRETVTHRLWMGVESSTITSENNLASPGRAEDGPSLHATPPPRSFIPEHLPHRSPSACAPGDKHNLAESWAQSAERKAPDIVVERVRLHLDGVQEQVRLICGDRCWNNAGPWVGTNAKGQERTFCVD